MRYSSLCAAFVVALLVGATSARGQLLLPYGNGNLVAHAAHHADNNRGAHETVALLLDALRRNVGRT